MESGKEGGHHSLGLQHQFLGILVLFTTSQQQQGVSDADEAI